MRHLVFGSFNLRFLPARTAFDWLSRDNAEVDAYIADPLCGFECSGSLWNQLLGGVMALEKEEKAGRVSNQTPLLLVAGSKDPVSMGDLGCAQLAKTYRKAGHHNVTDQRYEGGRHELLNEVNKDEVIRDIVQWMDAQLKRG